MRYIILLCFFLLLLLAIKVPAQTAKADSLLLLLKAAAEDTNKVNLLNNLCFELRHTEHEKALEYGNKALALAEKLNFTTGKGKSYNNIALAYFGKGDYPQSLKFHEKSFEVSRGLEDKAGMSVSHNNMGTIHYVKGDYSGALDCFLKALKLREEIGDSVGMSANYNNIGVMHELQENYKMALEYYFKSVKIKEKFGENEGLAGGYNNIGVIYNKLGNYKMALQFHENALKIREQVGDKNGTAASYTNIGLIYQNEKKYAAALNNYLKALKIQEELKDKRGFLITSNNIGNTLTSLGRYAEAVEYHNRAASTAGEIGYKSGLKYAYSGLADTYEKMNNAGKAYHYYKLYTEVKDSLMNSENTEKMAELQTKYDTEKKEKEIQVLTQEKEIQSLQVSKQQIELERQTTQRNGFIAGFALVLLLAGATFKGYKQKQKANRLLSVQNMEITTQKAINQEKNKHITDSIRYAKRIQEAILPPDNLVKELLPDSFILYKPKDIVSGDFYWIEAPSNSSKGGKHADSIPSLSPSGRAGEGLFPPNKEGKGGVLLAAVDCTGHGVPGAFMSIVGHNGLTRAVNENNLSKPADILDYLNKTVHETLRQTYEESSVRDGMDIALCSFDLQNSRVEFAGANNPLLLIRNKQIIEIPADKQPIGSFVGDTLKPFTNKEIELQKGDTLYLFTDGYADQFGGEKGKKFKYAKLKELLLAISEKPLSEQKQVLDETFETWKGDLEQVDDVCVIGVRV